MLAMAMPAKPGGLSAASFQAAPVTPSLPDMVAHRPLPASQRTRAALASAGVVAGVLAALASALRPLPVALPRREAAPLRLVALPQAHPPARHAVIPRPAPPAHRHTTSTVAPTDSAPLVFAPPPLLLGPMPSLPPPGKTATGGAGTRGAGDAPGGDGTGAGRGGSALAQLAGRIDDAHDYPPDPQGRRIGTSVLIVFTVGIDGRIHDCRVAQPSPDPVADATTCRLAEARFRFRPATDAAGEPIAGQYGWRQSWHK